MNYRITKFDPKKRNSKGEFLDLSEWCVIEDMGKPEYNLVNYEEFEKIENAYVDSIILILDEKKITNLKIDSLILYDFNIEVYERYKVDGRLKNIEINFDKEIDNLENGKILNLNEIQKIIRLVLREIIMFQLFNDDFNITFGYGFQMCINCSKLSNETVRQIENLGLFVEPNKRI